MSSKLLAIGASALLLSLVTGSVLATETKTYTYDALGRLVQVDNSGDVNDDETRSFCYDAAGNRVNLTSTSDATAAACVDTGTGGPPANLAFNGNVSVTEGGNLSFVVTRSGNTSIAASADYATSNGSAVAPGDYATTTGTVSFAISETSKTILVATVDDSEDEWTEIVNIALSNPGPSTAITGSSVIGYIIDND